MFLGCAAVLGHASLLPNITATSPMTLKSPLLTTSFFAFRTCCCYSRRWSSVSFDGNAVPFGIMELAAGISVTGRESPSLTLVPGSSIQNDNPNAMLVGYDIANHQATPTIRL